MPILAASAIDSSLVNEVINLVKSFMGLFSEFPLNVLLIGGLASMAFGIFRKGKKAAK